MDYRAISLSLVTSLTCVLGFAQDEPTPRPRVPRPSLVTQLHHSTEYKTPFTPDALHDHPEFFPPVESNPESANYHSGAANSVVRQPTVPYRTDNNSFGFRNPGHLAKVAEFYGPGEKFDSAPHDPIHPATYNEQTAALSRNAQIQAYNAGTARYNAVMQSIYAYSRPMGGYGFGMF